MTKNYKCHGCIWKDIHYENGEAYPICKRKWDMMVAMSECSKPGMCPHYMTQAEAERYIDNFTKRGS